MMMQARVARLVSGGSRERKGKGKKIKGKERERGKIKGKERERGKIKGKERERGKIENTKSAKSPPFFG